VEGRDGEIITRVFDSIQYCPLLQRRLQTVEIYIRDDTGSIVSFERERVVVTLHCRKRKEFSLEWKEFNPFLTSATQSETYSPSGNIACLNPSIDCNKGLMMTWQSFFTFIHRARAAF
jgi:hypothetical protein